MLYEVMVTKKVVVRLRVAEKEQDGLFRYADYHIVVRSLTEVAPEGVAPPLTEADKVNLVTTPFATQRYDRTLGPMRDAIDGGLTFDEQIKQTLASADTMDALTERLQEMGFALVPSLQSELIAADRPYEVQIEEGWFATHAR